MFFIKHTENLGSTMTSVTQVCAILSGKQCHQTLITFHLCTVGWSNVCKLLALPQPSAATALEKDSARATMDLVYFKKHASKASTLPAVESANELVRNLPE